MISLIDSLVPSCPASDHLSMHTSPTVRGFSLIELLTVIAVMSVLMALAFPAYQNMASKAKESQSVNNLQALGLATRLFAGENNNKFPMDYGGNAPPRRTRGPVAYHVATFRPLFALNFFPDKLNHPLGGRDYLKSSKVLYSPLLKSLHTLASRLPDNELVSHDGGLKIGYYAYSYPANALSGTLPTFKGKSFANQDAFCWGRALLYSDYWGTLAADMGGLISKNLAVAHVDGTVSLRSVATTEAVRLSKGDFAVFNYLATGEE